MSENLTTSYAVTVKKLPKALAEITASIPATEFDQFRSRAIKHLGEHLELPGFRKGHVPEKVLSGKIGEAAILEEMAEMAISKAYPAIIREAKLEVIGRPDIRITKIAMGNPLEFAVTTSLFPEITLPDYKKLAAESNTKKEPVVVSEEEIEKTVTEIKTMRARALAEEGGKEFDKDLPLPEIDDAYVKTLGSFENVANFMTKLHENILKEKERASKERARIAAVESILEKVKVDLPEIIIEQELIRIEEEFGNDIARMGMQFDDYLKQIKKTREEMKKDWRPEAEKRAKVQLMVSEIARKEQIEIPTDELEKEMNKLHIMYPNTPLERIRSYVDMVLTNEKVFQLLESL